MKVSLSNLLLLINQKEKEVNEQYSDVLKNSMITKDKELDGKETVLNIVEDFSTVIEKYEKSINELNNYKDLLAYTNATQSTESGLTIIQAINATSCLRKKLGLYDSLSSKKPSLNRQFDGNGGSAYYRVQDLNFELEVIKGMREEITNKISQLEADIQNTNATTFLEV